MSDARPDWVAEESDSLRVLEIASKVAAAPTTVLITGESGTGKDQLARWIHEAGPRRAAPLLKIDCSSLPPELVESELFGYERGAFTGAELRKLGRFELAGDGTIVLDEVAALSPAIQAKLLRVLEERKFERLGGTEMLKMHARLIALTNADLERDVRAGYFREDLYFRLNVLTIPIPALRARPRDIGPLTDFFLKRLAPVHGRAEVQIEAQALRALEAYAWPGNVRELKNAVEHALILGKGSKLSREDFPAACVKNTASQTPSNLRSLEQIEKEAVHATLEATHYKIARAAEILGISRKTLLQKRKKYGLL